MSLDPYYQDDFVTLYHAADGYLSILAGVLEHDYESSGRLPDLVVTDPPYGETSLTWDRWPEDWPAEVAAYVNSMWCFGSMRMFLDRRDDFVDWKFSQDIIWSKPRGGVAYPDRASVRSHEIVTHWYRGAWSDIYHEQQRRDHHGPGKGTIHRSETGPAWNGSRRAHSWTDDGMRAISSVIKCQTMRMRGTGHPTEKPLGILEPLITYACPPGGLVLDIFAGSGSTGVAAKANGRHALLIEADEGYCEMAAQNLAQDVLFGGVA